MKKGVFYTELYYVVGLMILAFGNALMAQGDFGVSMVVAPAYLLHLKLADTFPFFTFGMAEYVLQGFLLILMMILYRRVRLGYFLSFITAVIYGLLLDGAMAVVSLLPMDTLAGRLVFYAFGVPVCACGVSMLFRTYLPVEAYELFVKELAEKLGKPLHKVKTGYDTASCLLSIAMSLLFFGTLRGISIGTAVCALINGTLIGLFSRLWDRLFESRDALPLRKYI